MTDKQARFVDEYLIDCNATAAAKRAGYAESTAEKKAQRWVGKSREQSEYPEMWDAVEARRQTLRETKHVTQERVIEEYRRIAFADVRDLFTWDEDRAAYVPSDNLTEEQAAVVSSIEAKTTTRRLGEVSETDILLKLKTHDKLRALDALGKHLGIFEADNAQKAPPVVRWELHTPPGDDD